MFPICIYTLHFFRDCLCCPRSELDECGGSLFLCSSPTDRSDTKVTFALKTFSNTYKSNNNQAQGPFALSILY